MSRKQERKIHPVQWVLLLIPAGGFLWFSQSLLAGVMGVGTLIGWAACLAGAALILAVPAMVRKGGVRRVIAWVFTGIFAGAVAWCGYLSTLIFSAVENTPPNSSTVIVLGCLVSPNGEPSLSLENRIQKAAEYLQAHPEAVCIVSGGQGSVEPVSEASVMARELEELGIDSGRILQEDRSTDTQENMAYSAKIIEEQGLSREVAVVTDDYHQYRAGELAKEVGLVPYAVTVQSSSYLFPANYGRELVSMTKFFLERWLAVS